MLSLGTSPLTRVVFQLDKASVQCISLVTNFLTLPFKLIAKFVLLTLSHVVETEPRGYPSEEDGAVEAEPKRPHVCPQGGQFLFYLAVVHNFSVFENHSGG